MMNHSLPIRQRWFLYLVLPTASALLLVWMYFSGARSQQLVAPGHNREFGLLENVQALMILVVLVLAITGARRKSSRRERILFAGLAAVSFVALLEEIDYGLHFIELTRGLSEQQMQVRNLHNIGDNTDRIKAVNHTLMGLFFMVLPFCVKQTSRPLLRYLAPDRMSILTMISMILMTRLAHLLDDLGLPSEPSLSNNISEFGEFFVYYLWMLYFWELIVRRDFRALQSPEPFRSHA
jgi:hypothetical protein